MAAPSPMDLVSLLVPWSQHICQCKLTLTKPQGFKAEPAPPPARAGQGSSGDAPVCPKLCLTPSPPNPCWRVWPTQQGEPPKSIS